MPFTIDGSIRVHQRDEYVIRPRTVDLTFHPEIAAEAAGKLRPDELCAKVMAIIEGALTEASEVIAARRQVVVANDATDTVAHDVGPQPASGTEVGKKPKIAQQRPELAR